MVETLLHCTLHAVEVEMRYSYDLRTVMLQLCLICFAHDPGRDGLIPQARMIWRQIHHLASLHALVANIRQLQGSTDASKRSTPEKVVAAPRSCERMAISNVQEPNTCACLVGYKQLPASSSSGNSGGLTSGSGSSMMTASAAIQFFHCMP